MSAVPIKISIVTSVKNGAQFLGDAIASVASQTHSNWEYLIVDAGSIDGSYEIATEAAKNDARISIVRHENEPLYQSIIAGLDASTGDFLAWLNADDLYPPWSFSALAIFLAGTPQARWVTGFPGCWDENGVLRFVRSNVRYSQNDIRNGKFNLQGLGFLQQESMFFARSLFGALSAEDKTEVMQMKLAGDFLLWKKFAKHAPLHVAPTILGGFRRHGANMSDNNLDAYMLEARRVGAWTPPPAVAAIARKWNAHRAVMESTQRITKIEQEMAAETFKAAK